MTFYKDLTYYIDKHYENALNVGWEEHPEPFDYSRQFQDRIGAYLKYTVLTSRGVSTKGEVTFKDKTYLTGFAEFRVIGNDGTVYACPDSLIAKVFAGEYKLPDCFVSAVKEGMDPDSLTYMVYMDSFDQEHFWGASDSVKQQNAEIDRIIRFGNLDELKQKISENPDILKIMTDQGSLLNKAIMNGQEEIALYLAGQDIPFDMFHGRELLYAIETDMETVALKLIDRDYPMDLQRIAVNPLFAAIRKQMNSVAKRLFIERKDLIISYEDIYIGSCNLLQWIKRTQNDEMLQFIMNQYQEF